MAKDIIHEAVKNALIKDGWTIIDENFEMRFKELKFFGDIKAEKPIIAKRGTEKIIVEVKSFVSRSAISEFEKALGQYRIYKKVLEKNNSEAQLFLAIPQSIFKKFFSGEGMQMIISEENISLLVVNTNTEEIVEWRS